MMPNSDIVITIGGDGVNDLGGLADLTRISQARMQHELARRNMEHAFRVALCLRRYKARLKENKKQCKAQSLTNEQKLQKKKEQLCVAEKMQQRRLSRQRRQRKKKEAEAAQQQHAQQQQVQRVQARQRKARQSKFGERRGIAATKKKAQRAPRVCAEGCANCGITESTMFRQTERGVNCCNSCYCYYTKRTTGGLHRRFYPDISTLKKGPYAAFNKEHPRQRLPPVGKMSLVRVDGQMRTKYRARNEEYRRRYLQWLARR